MEEIIIVEPDFFSGFHCVGSECIDHCCKGWDVEFDKLTVNRYRESAQIEIRNIALNAIIITEKNESSWGKVKLNKNGNCSFLDEDSLCKVHKKLGAQALSTTCAMYPRIYTSYKYELRCNLTLSCPEAARMLLENKGSMLFNEKIKRSPFALDAEVIDEKERLINLMCANLMMNCGVHIEEGFCSIIKLLTYQNEMSECNKFTDKILDYYELLEIELKNEQKEHAFKPGGEKHLKNTLLTRIIGYLQTKNSGRGSSILQEYIINIALWKKRNLQKDISTDHIGELNITWKKKVMPWLEENSIHIINYIRYRIYEDFFPFGKKRDPMTNVFILLSEWVLLKGLLTASHEFKEDFSKDDVIKILYAFSSVTRHDVNAGEQFFSEIEEVGNNPKFTLFDIL